MAHSESNSSQQQQRGSNKNTEQRSQKNLCLYIGNIDKRIGQEELSKVFSQFGKMEYCYIVNQPYSDANKRQDGKSMSRGYGFVKYLSVADAEKAKQKMKGYDFNGRKINVQFSNREAPREKTPGRYLGKKRPSPVRRHRRSYSRSSSPRKRRHYDDKRRRHHRQRSYSRSRSSYRRRRRSDSSYSRSPRR